MLVDYPVWALGLRVDPLRLLAGCGNPSARAQLFAADRQTSYGRRRNRQAPNGST